MNDDGSAGPSADLLDTRFRAAAFAPDDRRLSALRAARATRSVMETLVATTATPELLDQVAANLELLDGLLEPHRSRRPPDGFAAHAGDPHAYFDWSSIVGAANPIAPPVDIEIREGKVHGRTTFGTRYEGPPGAVHGGHLASVFDEVLGIAHLLSGRLGFTAELTVRYRRPTPLSADVEFVGECTGIDDRKISTRADLWAGDVLTATAEGLFIVPRSPAA